MANLPAPRLTPWSLLTRWLSGSSALTSPARVNGKRGPAPRPVPVQKDRPFSVASDWNSFGPGARPSPTVSIPAQPTPRLSRSDFLAEMARRLDGLVSGRVSMRNRQAVTAAFRKSGLTVEKQTVDGGKTLHVIRDRATGQSVPAMRVSRKLSPKRLDASFERNAQRDEMLATEALAAHRYATVLGPTLGSNPAADWAELRFILAAAPTTGRAIPGATLDYAAKNGVGFIGQALDTVGWSEDETYTSVLRSAVTAGIPLPPRGDGLPWDSAPIDAVTRSTLDRHFVIEHATPGMPVLLRDANLSRAGRVHPSLALPKLEAAFLERGQSRLDAANGRIGPERERDIQRAVDGIANASLTASVRRNLAPKRGERRPATVFVPAPASVENEPGFGGLAEMQPVALSPRNVLVRFNEAGPVVVRRATNGEPECELPDVSVKRLPDGVYDVENEDGLPDGVLDVTDGIPERFGHHVPVAPEPIHAPAFSMAEHEGAEGEDVFGWARKPGE